MINELGVSNFGFQPAVNIKGSNGGLLSFGGLNNNNNNNVKYSS